MKKSPLNSARSRMRGYFTGYSHPRTSPLAAVSIGRPQFPVQNYFQNYALNFLLANRAHAVLKRFTNSTTVELPRTPPGPPAYPFWAWSGHADAAYVSPVAEIQPARKFNRHERKALSMQVLCKRTSHSPDVCCPVCAQGFVLICERQSKADRSHALRDVTHVLRSHHLNLPGPGAHPQSGFPVPHSSGSTAFSGAAVLGNAPSWAL
jgi:hypothetical protein